MKLLMALMVLFFSKSAPAGDLSLSTGICSPLLLTAALTQESATQQYLQYLKHFVQQDYLGLEDLEVLRNFATMPNLINIFGNKIPEAYVYTDVIEAILPLLDHSTVIKEIDRLISETSKQEINKERAYDAVAKVSALIPITLEPEKIDLVGEVTTFIDDDLGLLAIDQKGALWHLETKKYFPGPNISGHFINRFSRKYAGQNFIATVRGEGYVNREFTEFLIFARNAVTGEPIMNFTMESGKKAQEVELFLDDKGVLNAFWETRNAHGQVLALSYGSDKDKINRIVVGSESNHKRDNFIKYVTPSGRLFVMYDLFSRFSLENSDVWVLLDMSAGGKKVFSIPAIKDFRLKDFYQNIDGSFSILAENADQLMEYTITKKSDGTLKGNQFVFSVGGYKSTGYLKTFPLQNGHAHYVRNSNGLLLFKKGESQAVNLGHASNDPDWASSPMNSHYIVNEFTVNGLSNINLIDLQDQRFHKIVLNKDILKKWYFEGIRFTPDGRILAYYLAREKRIAHPTAYQIIQLYGPVNPKTGGVTP
jgi:hypothetical protein